MISSDGITRDISAEDAVPWQPRPLDELTGGAAPTLEERLELARKDGYQQGYSEAVAASEKIQSAQNERISELLRYLGQPLASVDETLKQSMLSLAAEMASQIVAREIGSDLDYYRTQLDQLSDKLPAQVKITSLRLRPEKARELRAIRDATGNTDDSLPEVVDDAELAGDVCLACWQDSAVDISLRGRLAAIVQSYCGDNTTEALAIKVGTKDTDTTSVNSAPSAHAPVESTRTVEHTVAQDAEANVHGGTEQGVEEQASAERLLSTVADAGAPNIDGADPSVNYGTGGIVEAEEVVETDADDPGIAETAHGSAGH